MASSRGRNSSPHSSGFSPVELFLWLWEEHAPHLHFDWTMSSNDDDGSVLVLGLDVSIGAFQRHAFALEPLGIATRLPELLVEGAGVVGLFFVERSEL